MFKRVASHSPKGKCMVGNVKVTYVRSVLALGYCSKGNGTELGSRFSPPPHKTEFGNLTYTGMH